MAKYPKNYMSLQKRFTDLIKAHEEVGKLAKEAGPIDTKTAHLIQLAACAAIKSEGGVHSHARRAMENGASKDEIYQTVALLMNTIGFPTSAAAFSWVNDIVGKKK